MNKYNLFIGLALVLSSCSIADLRTPEIKQDRQAASLQQKAQVLLTTAIQKQGLDQTDRFSTYEVVGSDHWKGLLGKMGNIWNWKQEKVAMRYALGDFDGQIEVLEGKKKGWIGGIQSWDYYEVSNGQYDTDVKDDKRIMFGLAAYHYYFELASRLGTAPLVRYVGKGEIEDKAMEKIWVSWGNERTKDYDQYVLWIGKESGLIEAASHTIRDTYLPMSGFLYSSIRFSDFKAIDGVLIPFRQSVQLKNPKDTEKKYIHQFNIDSFEWDAFPIEQLRPNQGIQPLGDDKLSIP